METPGQDDSGAATNATTAHDATLADRVRLIVSTSKQGDAFHALSSAVLVVFLWSSAPTTPLLIWLGITWLILASRIPLWLKYRQDQQRDSNSAYWLKYVWASTVACGVSWAILLPILGPHLPVRETMFCMVVIAGFVAAAAPYLSGILRVYFGYALMSLVPPTAYFFLQPEQTYLALGVMGVIFLAGVLRGAKFIHDTYSHSLQLGLRNQSLVQSLRGANEELISIRDALEQRIAARTEALRRELIERRERESALRDAKERLDLALEASNLVIFDVDVKSSNVFLSAKWAELQGLSPAEATVSLDRLLELVPDEERPALMDVYMRTLKGALREYNVEHRARMADGSWRWIASRAKVVERDETGKAVRLIGTNSDITERKRNERSLLLAANAFESMAEGMVILDVDWRIVSVNRAFTAITGYRADRAVGKVSRFTELPTIDGSTREDVLSSLRQHNHWDGEVLDRRANGELYPAWVSVSAVNEPDGRASNYVMLFTDISQQKRDKEHMHFLAYHDSLTRLPNRARFFHRFEEMLQRARRHDHLVALFFVDLDHFKHVNDSLGHQAGDALLLEVADRLKSTLREVDFVARLGGDEFAVLLPDLDHVEQAGAVADKLLATLARPFDIMGHELFVSATIGVSCYPVDGNQADVLVMNADAAMYRAKDEGRNRARFFSAEINADVLRRLTLASNLRGALERSEFELFYQPRVDVYKGRIVGLEALIRWHHPDRGLLDPVDFIDIAEETGVIAGIGYWVLTTACAQLRQWKERGHDDIIMSVNLSAIQFRQPDFVDMVRETIRANNLSPTHIELEITESMAMQDPLRTQAIVSQLRDMGVTVALDDFGTGHSSLEHLSRFSIQCLKIDRAFVDGIPEQTRNTAIVRAITSLAQTLSLDLIAEGVEINEQMHFLAREGCVQMQGHLFGRAVPAPTIECMLANRERAEWRIPPAANVTPLRRVT